MTATHIEFVSDIARTTCPDCSQDATRVAVLVNPHGLVLARGATCVHCGHARHRAERRIRREVRSSSVPRVRVPRVA